MEAPPTQTSPASTSPNGTPVRNNSKNKLDQCTDESRQPSVEGILDARKVTTHVVQKEAKPSMIGKRKTPQSKPGLGGGRKGLGGQKLTSKNFDEMEKEALKQDEERSKLAEKLEETDLRGEGSEKSARLAYEDLTAAQKKAEQQMKDMNPQKKKQMERLGMGVGHVGSQSHSAWASMDVIDQQGPVTQKPTVSSYNTDNSFFDSYSRPSGGGGYSSGYGGGRGYGDPPSYSEQRTSGYSSYSSGPSQDQKFSKHSAFADDPQEFSSFSSERRSEDRYSSAGSNTGPGSRGGKAGGSFTSPYSDDDLKKNRYRGFGSDQVFSRNTGDDFHSNQSKFSGSSSISSDEYFGRKPQGGSDNSEAGYTQIREGVSKMKNKLSDMIGSIQDRYYRDS